MSQFNSPAYDIERPTGTCAFTGRKLEVGEHYMACLVEIDAVAPAPAAPSEKADKTDKASKVAPVPLAPTSSKSAAGGLGFKRIDASMEAWLKGPKPERVFSYWKTTVAPPNQKRKTFVDDEVLLSLFKRLADTDQPERLAFRFVLALILMRKKLLKYEGSIEKPGLGEDAPIREWYQMSYKGQTDTLLVLNPNLDDAKIRQVNEQLSQVLEGEL